MRSRFLGACALTVCITGVAACGSDSSGPSRASVTNALLKSAEADGVEVDKDCASGVVSKFSDADFKIIAEDADSFDAESLSEDGKTLLVELFDCTGGTDGGTVPADGSLSTSQQAILDQINSSLTAQGLTVDQECLETLVSKIDTATVAAQDSEMLTQLGVEAATCLETP